MKKTLTFIFAFMMSSLAFSQPISLIKFTPASGINATSPSSVTFTAELLVDLTNLGLPGLFANSIIGSVNYGTISPSNVGTPTNTATGGLSVNITVSIPSGLHVNDVVSIPVTLTGQNPVYTATSTFNYTITVVLPVELAAFQGKSEKGGNLLTWETASEKENDHFDIERSLNGKDFQKIGSVKGAGTSEQSNVYSFTDNQKPEGKIAYYRLNIVDINGNSNYSKTIVVYDNKGKLDIKSANENFVNLETASTGDVELSLININGQSVLTKKMEVTEGYNSLEINTSSLSPGMYILHVTDGRGQKTVKIFKR